MSEAVTAGLVEPFGYGLAYPNWLDPLSPTVGTNYVHTVGGIHQQRILAATATLTTDANVANRLMSLDFTNARGVTYMSNAASVLVTASTTNQVFYWSISQSISEWNTGTPVWVPMLNAFLPPAFTAVFKVANIQAGDQLSNIHLWVENFPTGPRGYQTGMVQGEPASGY